MGKVRSCLSRFGGDSNIIGNVASSQSATVCGSNLTASKVVIIAVIVGGAATLIALLMNHREVQLTTKQKCDSVSPFRCP